MSRTCRFTSTSQRAMSPWRILLISIVCIQQVSGREEQTGYLGQSVVLKSGANTTWTLTKAQWSIYKNTTYIASLKDGEVILYSFWRHQGRLELNNRTGDLTIRNLIMNDSMVYTVALVTSGITRENSVHLTVQERLKEPNIQKMLESLKDGQCHVALNCAALHPNVNLSWTPSREFSGSYISGNAVDSSLILYTSFSGDRHMTFNCTASTGQQTQTKQITVGCSEEKKCEVCITCGSCTPYVIIWIFVLIATTLLGVCTFKNKAKIRTVFTDTLPNVFRNIRGTSPGGGHKKGHEDTEDKKIQLNSD